MQSPKVQTDPEKIDEGVNKIVKQIYINQFCCILKKNTTAAILFLFLLRWHPYFEWKTHAPSSVARF